MTNEGLKTTFDSVDALYGIVKPGDHLVFNRSIALTGGSFPYTHHGIVEEIAEDGRVIVIHYTDENGLSMMNAAIRRDQLSKIGERQYNLKTNNCEHFSTWCRNGASVCRQIKSLDRSCQYGLGTYAVMCTASLGIAAAFGAPVVVAAALAVVPAAVLSGSVYAAVRVTHKRAVRKLRKRFDKELKNKFDDGRGLPLIQPGDTQESAASESSG